MAINAATDTNTDDDRATIQKEIVQRLDEINDIASHTNFNGKYLLNGDYGKRTIYNTQTKIISTTTVNTTTEVSTTTIVSTTTTVNTTTEISTTTVISTTTIVTSTTVSSVAEPTTQKTLSGNTITEDGVYDLKGFTGRLNITATNVKLINTANNTLSNVHIYGYNKGDLWLKNINITNSYSTESAIMFPGTLHLCENSTNKITGSTNGSAIVKHRINRIYYNW